MGANGEIMEPTFVRMDFEYPEGLNDTLVLKKDKCKKRPVESAGAVSSKTNRCSTGGLDGVGVPKEISPESMEKSRRSASENGESDLQVAPVTISESTVNHCRCLGKASLEEAVLLKLGMEVEPIEHLTADATHSAIGNELGILPTATDIEISDGKITGPGITQGCLAEAVSDVVLRNNISEVLKFLKRLNLLLDKPMYGFSHWRFPSAHIPQVPKEVAEFYSLGRSTVPNYPDPALKKGGTLCGSPQLPVDVSVRNLFLLKFATKYTDYNVSTQWLNGVFNYPYGKKVDMLNRYIDMRGLRPLYEQYLHAQLHGEQKPTPSFPVSVCGSAHDTTDFRFYKFGRMVFHPARYRKRRQIWHTILHSTASSAEAKKTVMHGYNIHACPGMLDVNCDDSAKCVTGSVTAVAAAPGNNCSKCNQPWKAEEWDAKAADIVNFISEATLYVKQLQLTEAHPHSELYKILYESLAILTRTPLPTDQTSAGKFSCAFAKLADSFYRFWVDQQTYIPYTDRFCECTSGMRALGMIDRGIQHSDSSEQGTQTSDATLFSAAVKREVPAKSMLDELLLTESTPECSAEVPSNSEEFSVSPVDIPAADLAKSSKKSRREAALRSSSVAEIIRKFDTPDTGPHYATLAPPPTSRKDPINDRFLQSGWLLPEAKVQQSEPETGFPDSPAVSNRIRTFRVLDIQDSGEILVLENKGSELDGTDAECDFDYSAVVGHPLFRKITPGESNNRKSMLIDSSLLAEAFPARFEEARTENDQLGMEGSTRDDWMDNRMGQNEHGMHEDLVDAMSEMSVSEYHDALSSHAVIGTNHLPHPHVA